MNAHETPNRGKSRLTTIAICVSHTPRMWTLAGERKRAGKHCPVVKNTPMVVLHCPLPSRQSCLSEERPGHSARPNTSDYVSSQCIIHAERDTSNLRGCEILWKINVGSGFINWLSSLKAVGLSWSAKIWTLGANPLLQGNFSRAGIYSK